MLERQRTPAEILIDAKQQAKEDIELADKNSDSARKDLSDIRLKIAEVTASIERIKERTANEEDVGERARLDTALAQKGSELLYWKRELQETEQGLQKIGDYRDSGEAAIATTSEELRKHLN